MKRNQSLHALTYAAVCLALCLVLPFLTGQIPKVGGMLCPMHLPVMLCGFAAGPLWGAAVGLIAPVMRHLVFHMPPYPSFVAMAFELAAYGLVCGLLYRVLPRKKGRIYAALLPAMVLGRALSGLVMGLLLHLAGKPYPFAVFFAACVTQSVPGMILQLILLPVLVVALERGGYILGKKA